MSIIKTHDVTLYGGNGSNIVLHPLCDEHLPYLYKWCTDPEVLYWTEGGTTDIIRLTARKLFIRYTVGFRRTHSASLLKWMAFP